MLKRHIQDYFRSLLPSPATGERLRKSASAASPADFVAAPPADFVAASPADFVAAPPAEPAAALRPAAAQRRPGFGLALFAAAAVLAVFAIGYSTGRRGTPPAGGVPPPGPAIALTDGPPPASTRPSLEPRLVLFKMHADWCPRSPKVAPIFQELGEKFANEPVLFVTFDITDAPRQRQAMLLAKSLGILDQIGDHRGEMIRMEPGLIRLVDRHAAEIVCTLRERGEQPEFEAALAHVLPRQPRGEP